MTKDWRNAMIEEAAKALTELTDAEWEIATAEGTEHLTGYFDAARRCLAVFEKALGEATVTPTDDGGDPGGRLFRSSTYKALAERDFTGHMDEGRRTAFYEGWGAREQWDRSHAQPQGEPSDAQVTAAMIAYHSAYLDRGIGYVDAEDNRVEMRAALRAAGAVL